MAACPLFLNKNFQLAAKAAGMPPYGGRCAGGAVPPMRTAGTDALRASWWEGVRGRREGGGAVPPPCPPGAPPLRPAVWHAGGASVPLRRSCPPFLDEDFQLAAKAAGKAAEAEAAREGWCAHRFLMKILNLWQKWWAMLRGGGRTRGRFPSEGIPQGRLQERALPCRHGRHRGKIYHPLRGRRVL